MSSEERSSASNGLWLCDNHAREIDHDPARFSSEILRIWKVHAEEDARAMLGRPVSATGLEVAMELSLQRDLNDGILVVGETNLPDGTKLIADLRWSGDPPFHAQAHTNVFSRRLTFGPFTDSSRALPQRWYEVEVCSYFNAPWDQPAHVIEMVGPDGSKLLGSLASPVDPDLDETDYAVRARIECPAPPLQSETSLSTAEVADAIRLLQNSVLDVQGHSKTKSSEPVGEVVNWYMKAPGLKERDGWSTEVRVPGIVDVKYSFWDGDKLGEARWQVIARSREVRYRNKYAKMMSWLPDY